MTARRARRLSIRAALVSLSLSLIAGSLACTRESPAPASEPRPGGSSAAASASAASAPASASLARDRPYGRTGDPKVRVVPAGLRVLAIRGGDAGGAATLLTTTASQEPTTKPVAMGDRFGAGDKLQLSAGLTIAARSALEGLEIELAGPGTLSILADETMLLFEGDLKVLGSPRAPGMVATPDGFVVAPPGTLVGVHGRKGTTVSLSGAGSGTGTGTAMATSGEAWETQRVSTTLVLGSGGRSGDVDGVARCRKMAERARSAWNFASSTTSDAGSLPGAGSADARLDAWARQTEARTAARTACSVARLLVERRPDAGASSADLAAADALWRELPSSEP